MLREDVKVADTVVDVVGNMGVVTEGEREEEMEEGWEEEMKEEVVEAKTEGEMAEETVEAKEEEMADSREDKKEVEDKMAG